MNPMEQFLPPCTCKYLECACPEFITHRNWTPTTTGEWALSVGKGSIRSVRAYRLDEVLRAVTEFCEAQDVDPEHYRTAIYLAYVVDGMRMDGKQVRRELRNVPGFIQNYLDTKEEEARIEREERERAQNTPPPELLDKESQESIVEEVERETPKQ